MESLRIKEMEYLTYTRDKLVFLIIHKKGVMTSYSRNTGMVDLGAECH